MGKRVVSFLLLGGRARSLPDGCCCSLGCAGCGTRGVAVVVAVAITPRRHTLSLLLQFVAGAVAAGAVAALGRDANDGVAGREREGCMAPSAR